MAETRGWDLVRGTGLLGTCLLRGYTHLAKGESEAQQCIHSSVLYESAVMGKGQRNYVQSLSDY